MKRREPENEHDKRYTPNLQTMLHISVDIVSSSGYNADIIRIARGRYGESI